MNDTSSAIRLPPVRLLVAMQAAVAAASLVVEIVAGRMLAPYLGMSLYTWTSVIAVVLAGFSAGHWAGGRIAERQPVRALALTGWCMAGAAATTGAATLVLRWSAEPVIGAVSDPVGAIVALTMLAFFLPSFFAGVPAPVLAHIAVLSKPEAAGRALGAMFAAGALGAIAGTLLAGFVFISWLGSTKTLVVVAAVYMALALLMLLPSWRAGRAPASIAVLVLPAGISAWSMALPDPCTYESDYFCIRVIDVSADAGEPARLMVLDHLGHGITVRDAPQRMLTPHASMLDIIARARMEGREFSAFFIGGGSYSIPRAWTETGIPARMTVAEIDPIVTQAAKQDFWFDPATADIRHADARLVLAGDATTHDVIIGDAFTDIAVPAHLVTREFFELVASRLNPGGVYLMNIIDHVDGLDALASVVKTLRQVFPVVEVWAEPNPPGADQRLVFIVLAGDTPTSTSSLTGPAPDFNRAGRLSQDAVDALVSQRNPPVLTDDFAPIDRLMARFD
jgi:spermidine synthase